jgi:hypothetical protein
MIDRDSGTEKRRGSFKGAIRNPMRSLMLVFNALALSHVSCKSLKFQSLLFSIPTAPTNIFFSNSELGICEGA